jgi:transcriptional regulator with XRE-family HTH domain
MVTHLEVQLMINGTRIKELRHALHITQSNFGAQIGLRQATIGMYEHNQRNVSDRTVADICRVFHVNEEWLRTGEGDMFIQPDAISLDEYSKEKHLSPLETSLVREFIALDPATRSNLVSMLGKIFNTISHSDNERQDQ